MGLLPCGLVYAMLAVVATLPHPLLSASGMVVFGLGTLPALIAVLLSDSSMSALPRGAAGELEPGPGEGAAACRGPRAGPRRRTGI
ncbi:MAG: sulfite exporter TauE/SafE family protein [Planctomycetes bacterium]|nr:sulfite exporter TauE/SafE family protein [Planctomycetota bacterium]